jgi:hypothetical protein
MLDPDEIEGFDIRLRIDNFEAGKHMIDLRLVDTVEIQREPGGERLYVHVDGITVLRIYGAKNVILTGFQRREDESA